MLPKSRITKSIHKLQAPAIRFFVLQTTMEWLLNQGMASEDILISALDYAASHLWIQEMNTLERDTINKILEEADLETKFLVAMELVLTPSDTRVKWVL